MQYRPVILVDLCFNISELVVIVIFLIKERLYRITLLKEITFLAFHMTFSKSGRWSNHLGTKLNSIIGARTQLLVNVASALSRSWFLSNRLGGFMNCQERRDYMLNRNRLLRSDCHCRSLKHYREGVAVNFSGKC